MGIFKRLKRNLCFVVFAAGAQGAQAYVDESFFAFDDPFPATPFKNALRLCAQTWELFDVLAVTTSGDLPDRSLIIDAALGRLMRLQDAIDILAKKQANNECLIPLEDMTYLQIFVDKIVDMQRDARLGGTSDSLITNLVNDVCESCSRVSSAHL